MDMKDQLGSSVGVQNNGDMDRFPDGMRVLAVDDDLTHLKFLEAALRKCNYEVTTANHAYKALEILRENRNKFDLLISDVQMPDMDGFQLLQLLGHEMDLPVIMVSGDGDTELMKKGISHGACCYLVKPVDIEVFKTIWQHVFREKRLNAKDQSKSSNQEFQDKVCNGKGESEEGISAASSSDQNGKHKIKRKHQNEDDEGGEHDDENEEPSIQKKRRLNLTDDENEKHKMKRKHQDEDDEGGKHDEDENEESSARKKPRFTWTDELHKRFVDAYYRLGPEKAVPKAMLALMNVEGLSRANVASHLQKFREQLKKGSINQNGRASMVVDLERKDSSYMPCMGAVDESGVRLSNPAPLSYSCIPPQMLSGSNSPAGFSMRSVYPSSHLMRPGQSQIFCNSINNVSKLQVLPNQSRNHFQVSPAPVQLNQLQQKNSTIDTRQFSPSNRGSATTFPYERLPRSSVGYNCNTSTVQGNQQPPLNPKYFDNALCRSSNVLDNNGYGESWQGGMQGCSQLCQFPPAALLRNEDSNFGQLPANNLSFSSSTHQIGNSTPNDFSSCPVVPAMHSTPNQWWEDTNWNLPSIVSNNGIANPLSQTLDQNDAVSSRSTNSSLFQNDRVQCLEVQNSTMPIKLDSNEDYILLEQAKSNDGLVQNSLESLDNQVQLDQNELINLLDEEFGFDAVQEQNANGEYDLLDGGFGFEA